MFFRLFIPCFFYYVDSGEKSTSKRKRGDCSVDAGKKEYKGKKDSGRKEYKVKKDSDEESESKLDKRVKKKGKLLTEDEVKHLDYLKKLPILQARSAPTALHTAIHGIKNVNIEKFLAEIGFNSFSKFDINKIPSRLGRYVVENFEGESCRLKLEGGKSIQVTVNKVHELLGIPIGGEPLFSLGSRPDGDDFEKVWLRQFEPTIPKKIRVNDIATKLIEAKEVDFLFKVNFLTLFTNTMGMVAGLKGEINLDVVKHVREHTDIRTIDWCDYIFHCLKVSRKPTTLQNKYTGPYTFLVVSFKLYKVLSSFHFSDIFVDILFMFISCSSESHGIHCESHGIHICLYHVTYVCSTHLLYLSYSFSFIVFCFQLLYLDSTKYKKLPFVRTRPVVKNWSSFLMSRREDMELKDEVIGKLDIYDESEEPETEGFIAGCSSGTSIREVGLVLFQCGHV